MPGEDYNDGYGRADLMTPFSLSLAAEQAIENAKLKLEEMDSRLYTARSSIARFREQQQGDGSSTSMDPGRSVHSGTPRSQANHIADMVRLRDDVRSVRERLRLAPAMTHSSALSPPRPERPSAAQIPDLSDLARTYRDSLNLELLGTISFADMKRASDATTQSAVKELESPIATPRLGHYVLDGEEREPAPEQQRWRKDSTGDYLLKPFSISVGQYRRQDSQTQRPPAPLWHRQSTQGISSDSQIPRPAAPTPSSVSKLPQNPETAPRPVSPTSHEVGSSSRQAIIRDEPSTPKRPSRLVGAMSSADYWSDPAPMSPSQTATAILASPATATLKRVQSTSTHGGGRSSQVVSPATSTTPATPRSGDGQKLRVRTGIMQPRQLQYSRRTTVDTTAGGSSIPRPTMTSQRSPSSAGSSKAHESAVAAAVLAMQTHPSPGLSPSLVQSPTTPSRAHWPAPVSPNVTPPRDSLAHEKIEESPQTRLLRERFERALNRLESPMSSPSRAGQARIPRQLHYDVEKEQDKQAARKLEAALRILEE